MREIASLSTHWDSARQFAICPFIISSIINTNHHITKRVCSRVWAASTGSPSLSLSLSLCLSVCLSLINKAHFSSVRLVPLVLLSSASSWWEQRQQVQGSQHTEERWAFFFAQVPGFLGSLPLPSLAVPTDQPVYTGPSRPPRVPGPVWTAWVIWVPRVSTTAYKIS